MLSSDGYGLTYYKNKNQIVISLPQTYETATNTYEQVVDRRTDVMETDMIVLIEIVKVIFHKEMKLEDPSHPCADSVMMGD